MGGGGGGKEGEEILPLGAQRLYSETVFSATKWKLLKASFSSWLERVPVFYSGEWRAESMAP